MRIVKHLHYSSEGAAAAGYRLNINGSDVFCAQDKSLLRYLRDDLKLLSVKDGCSQGACGTCTIIINGEAKRACVLKTSRLEGARVITVEGLDPLEQEAYVYAFGECGAVQCGFCIPGMVMSAKALLDQNLNPSEDEIKKALRGNICRCTGYRKIIEAIQMTAAILRGEREMQQPAAVQGVGARAHRIDVRPKVLGYGEYTDDIVMPGMTYASAVRTKYPGPGC